MPRLSAAYCGWLRWRVRHARARTRFASIRRRHLHRLLRVRFATCTRLQGDVTLILDSPASEQHNAYTIFCGPRIRAFPGKSARKRGRTWNV